MKRKDLGGLNKLKEEYTSHFVQAVKLKAIHKEQERFKCSVIENSRRVAEKIKRSEMVKCMEPCVFLRIAFDSFSSIILPLIREELDVKIFCLHKLEFLSVNACHQRFTTEELIPVAYHLTPRVFNLGDTIVNPHVPPTSMQLICHGICDIIWLHDQKSSKFKSQNYHHESENPLQKFDSEIHDMIKDLHNRRSQYDSLNLDNDELKKEKKNLLSKQGFRVQRLIKGDAITIRGLSPPDSYSHKSTSNDIWIVAGSNLVKTYELDREKVKFLPPEIRVILNEADLYENRKQCVFRLRHASGDNRRGRPRAMAQEQGQLL